MIVVELIVPTIILLSTGLPLLAYIKGERFDALISKPQELAFSYLLGEFCIVIWLMIIGISQIGFHKYVCLAPLVITWALYFLLGKKEVVEQTNFVKFIFAVVGSLLLAVFLFRYTAQALFHPITAWDARSIWFFHAKAFFFDNTISLEFLKNPNYLWSHPDYPPGLPLLAVFHSLFFGAWSEVFSKSFLIIHWYCVLLALGASFIRRGVSSVIAAAVIVFIDFYTGLNCLHGYADAFMATLLVLALLQENFRLRLLLLASCLLIKNEALVFVAAIYSCRLLIDRFRGKTFIEAASCLLPVLIWKSFCLLNNIEGEYSWNIYSLGSFTVDDFLTRSSLIIEASIFAAKSDIGLSGLILCASALVVSPIIFLVQRHQDILFFWLSLILILASIFFIYLTAPISLPWLLKTSVTRLFYTPVVLAISLTTLLIARLSNAEYKRLFP